ncbi:hypothetical protein DTO164E3_5856 [Paecilomyces variotii]|nr:hypothetical protein DTO032I3_6436 [Paecilomyces variotii]KAJ9197142.1 hypothetical protein DTO164E3_5856 [Paecilomyces variotii]KAJ9219629.1 hypothetical protein DTO169C6_8003 [Paecilomyces variotii]KAJ9244327.1 hypothetical protein DTO169E5_1932 [Paecilomyces variotii]KAJ9275093.1 hypothetical protein DTO021D3_8068 [Paecilomyces variotii]
MDLSFVLVRHNSDVQLEFYSCSPNITGPLQLQYQASHPALTPSIYRCPNLAFDYFHKELLISVWNKVGNISSTSTLALHRLSSYFALGATETGFEAYPKNLGSSSVIYYQNQTYVSRTTVDRQEAPSGVSLSIRPSTQNAKWTTLPLKATRSTKAISSQLLSQSSVKGNFKYVHHACQADNGTLFIDSVKDTFFMDLSPDNSIFWQSVEIPNSASLGVHDGNFSSCFLFDQGNNQQKWRLYIFYITKDSADSTECKVKSFYIPLRQDGSLDKNKADFQGLQDIDSYDIASGNIQPGPITARAHESSKTVWLTYTVGGGRPRCVVASFGEDGELPKSGSQWSKPDMELGFVPSEKDLYTAIFLPQTYIG